MLLYLISALILLIALERIRNGGRETRLEEHRYKLYALRDRLRETVMSGEVDGSSWLFSYLDSSIAKTIYMLPGFTLWRVLAMYVSYKDDERVLAARRHLSQSLANPKNELFAEIHDEFMGLMVTFLIRRHLAAMGVSVLTWTALSGIKSILRDTTEVATESPETSTLIDHCPQTA